MPFGPDLLVRTLALTQKGGDNLQLLQSLSKPIKEDNGVGDMNPAGSVITNDDHKQQISCGLNRTSSIAVAARIAVTCMWSQGERSRTNRAGPETPRGVLQRTTG